MQIGQKPTFIDLFAGCGGLSQGLENAGFFPLYVNELNDDARETYLRNRDAHFPHLRKRFSSGDIKSVIATDGFFNELSSALAEEFQRSFEPGEVDLVVGGPPCQGFSGIGIRRSYSVEKKQLPSNHLFQDMAYFIHSVQPKMFLFENVEGLLRARWTNDGKKGEIFEDVLATFRAIEGYNVRFKLVHAKSYGVPQNRPRIILIGIREDIKLPESESVDAIDSGFLPRPTNGYPNLREILDDLVDPDFEYGGSTTKYTSNVTTDWQRYYRTRLDGKLMSKNSPLLEQEYSKHNETVRARFEAMISNGGVIPHNLKTKKFAQRLLPAEWGEQGPTITTTSLPDDFVHYSQARIPTVREWARMQTFPDWYEFAGRRTTGGIRRAGNPRESIFAREAPKYTQIGNAVPVKMAEAFGKHLHSILRD